MKALEVLIVDDHSTICDCLKTILTSRGKINVVGMASRGEDACTMAGEINPDIIIMDISMPGLGGAAATKRIKQQYPQIKVLVFSAYEDDAYVRQLLAAGAEGYVLKGASTYLLLEAIEVVARGETYIDPLLQVRMVDSLKREQPEKSFPPAQFLSSRETSVLRLAARGLTNKEMSEIIGVSVKTIEANKTHLYKKLNLQSRADLVRYALTHGWLKDEVLSN